MAVTMSSGLSAHTSSTFSADATLPSLSLNRASYFVSPLSEVRESPKKPQVLECDLEVARDLREEFKDIFTSRHSERCEALREKLLGLDELREKLISRIAFLEREVAAANAERMMAFEKKGDDEVSKSQGERTTITGPRTSFLLRAQTMPDSDRSGTLPDGDGEVMDDAKDGASSEPLQRLQTTGRGRAAELKVQKADVTSLRRRSSVIDEIKTLYDPTGALAQYRRAEQRLKKEEELHKRQIQHLRQEIEVVNLRIVRQQHWMKHVDEEVLKAEIAKAKLQVRTETAERKVNYLGKEIYKAYEEMTRLLKDRLAVYETAIHNEAVVEYIAHMGKEDKRNHKEFAENGPELKQLLKVCALSHDTRREYEEIMEAVQEKERLAQIIIDHTDTVATLNEQLQKLWIAVPASMKETIFRKAGAMRGASIREKDDHMKTGHYVHPATALQGVQGAAMQIRQTCLHYRELFKHSFAAEDGESSATNAGQTSPRENMDSAELHARLAAEAASFAEEAKVKNEVDEDTRKTMFPLITTERETGDRISLYHGDAVSDEVWRPGDLAKRMTVMPPVVTSCEAPTVWRSLTTG